MIHTRLILNVFALKCNTLCFFSFQTEFILPVDILWRKDLI